MLLIVWPGCRINQIDMAKWTMTTFICTLICLNFISAAEVYDRNKENRRRAETDAVSNLFSELGNLFLDIDETLAVQTAPKVELEGLVAQLLRPSKEYFSNVQENYRTHQKRLGSFIRQSLTPKNVYTDRDLSTVGPPVHGEKSKQDFPSPQVPLAKVNKLKTTGEEKDYSSQPTTAPNSVPKDECSVGNPFQDSYRRKKCSQRLRRHIHTDDRFKKSMGRSRLESRLKNQFPTVIDPDELDTYPNDFSRRGGDVAESTPKPQGRILGDIFYSESLFDRGLRQLLRDHGKWILDNPFLTRWQNAAAKDNSDVATEASTTETEVKTESVSDMTPEMETTQVYIPITTEYRAEIPVSEKAYMENRIPLKSSSYYKLMNNDDMVEEVEFMLNPDSNLKTARISETDADYKRKSESEGSNILAFTPDGIPLKLRIGPEIENPFRFLHKILQSAGVSLNVPVETYDDLTPVGKEVLKFGAGVLARPAYYDLSNRDDLKTLLRTLMKSKASGESLNASI